MNEMTGIWIKSIFTLRRVWAEFVGWWKSTQTQIADWFAKRMLEIEAARTGRSGEWLAYVKGAVERQTRADLARIETKRDAELRALTQQHAAEMAAADALHRHRLADISDEHDAQVAATESALEKARREWREALDQARRQREAAGAEAPGVEEFDAAGRLRQLQDELGTLDLAVQRASAVGTFSAAAAWGLDMGNVFDRTARATEATAKSTASIERKLQGGAIVCTE